MGTNDDFYLGRMAVYLLVGQDLTNPCWLGDPVDSSKDQ